MLSNLITVSGQVITLFLMMIAGYCLGKTKLLPRSALPALTNVVVYLALPCMLIGAFEMEATSERVHGFLWVLAASVLVHGLNFAVAHFGIRDPDDGRKRVLVDCAVFSNCGFMGYPLLASLMGDIGLFYGSAYNLIFTALLWTAGISYLQHRKGPLRLRRLILNPGIIGMALGFSVFLLQIQLPPVLETTVDYLGNVAVSLPMLIIGCQLAHADLKRLLHDRWSWVGAALRLLVMPLLALLPLYLLGLRGDVLMATVICAAAPPAAMVAMLAENCGRDPVLASGVVSFHTLLSVVTMPVVVSIAQLFA
ncbi:MAG: AEC family transporter [Dysosmobacter sp.]|nr:AEC family transporter [Dysosmobacter sp.]